MERSLELLGCEATVKRLGLGTVQFGSPYGIANESGQMTHDESRKIVRHAEAAGMDTIDTAIDYGDSERRLGEIGIGRSQVTTKLPPIPESCLDVAAWVENVVFSSLERLRIPRLYGLLMHRSQELLGPRGESIYQALLALKEEGKVEKIGVSIYGPDELDAIWPYFQLDLVQAPFNIMDRRLATSGWLARLRYADTEVHIRSIFLQGLLLMGSQNRPTYFGRWQPLWDQWHRWLDYQSLTPLQACLGFALSEPHVHRVLVGVDSLKQLMEIMSGASGKGVSVPRSLETEDLQLLDPSNWKKQ